MQWDAVELENGAAYQWQEPGEDALWRLEGLADEVWLTSPALPDAGAAADHRLAGLQACLAEHLATPPASGVRFVANDASQVSAQMLLQGMSLAAGRSAEFQASVEAGQRQLRHVWQDWSDAMLSGQAPRKVDRPRSTEGADFDRLSQLITQDPTLSTVSQRVEDEQVWTVEPEDEHWVAGIVLSHTQGHVDVVLPLGTLPSQEAQATARLVSLLQFNAGQTVGSTVLLGLDMSEPSEPFCVLKTTLDLGAVQPEDLQAAIGHLLNMAQEIQAQWGQNESSPQVDARLDDLAHWQMMGLRG